MNPSPPFSALRLAWRKWRTLPQRGRLDYIVWAVRGRLRQRHFAASRFPLLGRRVWIRNHHGSIRLGSFVQVNDDVGLSTFGPNADHPAELTIGDYTRIGPRTHINCALSIRIGARCAISWDCEILDTNIHTIVWQDGSRTGPAAVVIEDQVWIGTRAIVLKGVTIGQGAIVGAGSVVTQDIPAHTLAIGNPARPIQPVREWLP